MNKKIVVVLLVIVIVSVSITAGYYYSISTEPEQPEPTPTPSPSPSPEPTSTPEPTPTPEPTGYITGTMSSTITDWLGVWYIETDKSELMYLRVEPKEGFVGYFDIESITLKPLTSYSYEIQNYQETGPETILRTAKGFQLAEGDYFTVVSFYLKVTEANYTGTLEVELSTSYGETVIVNQDDAGKTVQVSTKVSPY